MSIILTTNAAFDEVGGDPGATANQGKLYTKDVATITQLFYQDSAGTVQQLTGAGGFGGWVDDGVVVRLATATDMVAIGDAVNVAARSLSIVENGARAGIVVSGSAGSNSLDARVPLDTNPRLQLIAAAAGGQIAFGPGNAATDITLTRGTSTRLDLSQNFRVAGGTIDRLEAALTVRTTRLADGPGDTLSLIAADGASAAGASAGGAIAVTAGAAVAAAGTQAAGGGITITAGAAASGAGGAAADGGDIILRPGAAAGGGVAGDIISSNVAGNTGMNIVPVVTDTGSIGTAALKWNLVRATTITSGAYYEEEVFAEEALPLDEKSETLKVELVQNDKGLRHLAKIGMVTAQAVREMIDELKALVGRVEALEGV